MNDPAAQRLDPEHLYYMLKPDGLEMTTQPVTFTQNLLNCVLSHMCREASLESTSLGPSRKLCVSSPKQSTLID